VKVTDVAALFRSGFNASRIPAARVRPLSDTLSLFDAVPFLACPCVWLRAGSCTATIEQAETSKAKK
jgi:hypothetical protein